MQYGQDHQKLGEVSPELTEIRLDVNRFENRLDNLKDQQLLTDKLIDLHTVKFQIELEKVRKDTIDALTKFVKESKARP